MEPYPYEYVFKEGVPIDEHHTEKGITSSVVEGELRLTYPPGQWIRGVGHTPIFAFSTIQGALRGSIGLHRRIWLARTHWTSPLPPRLPVTPQGKDWQAVQREEWLAFWNEWQALPDDYQHWDEKRIAFWRRWHHKTLPARCFARGVACLVPDLWLLHEIPQEFYPHLWEENFQFLPEILRLCAAWIAEDSAREASMTLGRSQGGLNGTTKAPIRFSGDGPI